MAEKPEKVAEETFFNVDVKLTIRVGVFATSSDEAGEKADQTARALVNSIKGDGLPRIITSSRSVCFGGEPNASPEA